MAIFMYSAAELYNWITSREDVVFLDVRNSTDFARFHVESPYPIEMYNVSYFDFMEIEEECVAKVPKGRRIRVICAKEGSAKYVSEILEKHGFDDVGYLEGGIKSWGNLLVPVLLNNPGEPFSLYQFIRPGKASCSYGLIHQDQLMLFDPSRNISFYLNFAERHGCRLVKTFETHLQADYIAGSRLLAAATGAEFLANSNDFSHSKITYTPLKDGEIQRFSAGGPEVRVFFTPGHTPGSTSYIIDNRFMLSGDTIFIHSIGRPDLGGKVDEWSDTLFHTLEKIRTLDDSLTILPGHYMSWEEADARLTFATSLGQTKEYNKSIHALGTTADFLTFIKANMRKQPDEYATIRRINAHLEEVGDEKAEELDLGKNECAATAYAAAKAA